MQLSDYGRDRWSQFGEDGIVEHIFTKIGTTSKQCVEFGAGDGLSCSSTAYLWRKLGWKGLLVEPDPDRFEKLVGNTSKFDTELQRTFVAPKGKASIGSIAKSVGMGDIDYMSIDVDGDDYAIFKSLSVRPRVICVEFNPTIPPHIELHQTTVGDVMGASLAAFIRLGRSMSYEFIGATYCNAFFVDAELAEPFESYEKDPVVLFQGTQYAYAVTDFAGRVVLVGQEPPWGLREPYVKTVASSHSVFPPTNEPSEIVRGFEAICGPAFDVGGFTVVSVDGVGLEALHKMVSGQTDMWLNGSFVGNELPVKDGPALVCFDVSDSVPGSVKELRAAAAKIGYRSDQVGCILALIKESHV